MQQWKPWESDGRIAELLGELAKEEGYTQSWLDAVRFVRVNGAKPRAVAVLKRGAGIAEPAVMRDIEQKPSTLVYVFPGK